MKSIYLALLLIIALASAGHAAKLDTSFTFSTLETPHFSLHFHQGLEPIAQKAAVMAEEVHRKLVREFLWEPSQRTQIVLIDDSDFANGAATPIPYNTIYLQTVPPSLVSTIGEYDDWLKVLITHEYTHIVTSDAARGYSKVTRAIFGKPLPGPDPLSAFMFLVAAPPNAFMPHWWHEGMATWAETEFTGVGRGRATLYDTIFRAAVAENNIPSIDRINGELPDWPNGHLPYLYGYKLQRYIADTYGKEALGKLTLAQAGRFPYFINAPPAEIAGKDFRGIYWDMIQQMKREQSARIALLSQAPFTPLRTIYNQGENLMNPRFSPDGSRIAFNRRDPHDHTMTLITDREGSTVQARFRRRSSDDGSLSWSPDGKTLYFNQAEIVNGFDVYLDLYAYQLEGAKLTRLTKGLRLRDVELSPDGKVFAAVLSNRGSQNVALLDMPQAGRQQPQPRLLTDYSLQRVSSPRWSPDSRYLSYTVTDNAGQTAMHLYELATGADRTLFTANHNAAFPTWSKDGSFLIYVSDETGVFNLFAYDLAQKKSYQVSHLLTGALQPEIAPDGKSLLVSSYGSRGFSIASLALDRERWSERRGPALPGREAGTAFASTEAAPEKALMDAPYAPWNTLYPHFWLPRISGDGGGSGVYGLFTAGQDVLGYNSYLLTLDYSAGRKRPYTFVRYDFDYFYPTLSLTGYVQPFLYSDLVQRGDYYELNRSLSLDVSVPINFLESRYRLRGGYTLQDQQALSPLSGGGLFSGLPVFQGRRDHLFAGVTYSSQLKYPYSISFEEGRSVSLLYRRFARALGSDLNSSEYSASYSEYLRLPTQTLKHHVLYFNIAGAAAGGDRTVQQAFQLGGLPSELNPYSLRGYQERSATGRYVAKATVEYRLPLGYPMRGQGTFPLFRQKVHAALFADAGKIWGDQPDPLAGTVSDEVKIGAGAELRMDVTLGYWLKVTPALGFAHGFNSGGINQIYFTIYADL